jgi:ubiquinone/menaquinone biosynthesis C-methylase UbiE
MSIDLGAFKDGQRNMWTMGDYPSLAQTIQGAADTLVARAGIGQGTNVLDVATGSGNVAVAAATTGARVTGLDLTPKLLDVARERAAAAGLQIEFVEGDAEELPFEDDRFDVVTSCFGAMFAPRHELAARELARVARPGGTVAVAAWTPEGLNGRMFEVVGSYMPPPPEGFVPPIMWGTEDHMRKLFAASDAELSFERAAVTIVHDSPESWVKYSGEVLGPAIIARSALEADGRADQLEAELIGMYASANEAEDGTLSAKAEYLLTLARLPGGGS